MVVPHLPRSEQIPSLRDVDGFVVSFRVNQFDCRDKGTALKAAYAIYARDLTVSAGRTIEPFHGALLQ